MQGNVIIPLTKGKVAVIDAEDAERILRHRWYACVGGIYACHHNPRVKGKQSLRLMHRDILGLLPGEEADHINGNGLDNRRCNLRRASRSQNNANRTLPKHNTSGYRGVYLRENGRWSAQITVDGRVRHLGRFDAPEDAARVYDVAARHHFGSFARLNFPESPE